MTSKILAVSAAAVAALALAGCGKQGELERPRPLVGHPTQPTADQRRASDAAARARADNAGVGHQAPQSVDEVRGLEQQNDRPLPNAYQNPVQGAPVGPDQPVNQGVLPDPLRPNTVPE